jgi:hypothetical protein
MNEPSIAGKILSVLSVLEGEADPSALLAFGPASEEELNCRYTKQLQRRLKRGGAKEIIQRFHSWAERSPNLPIKDIHPSWILELIRDERPRVIGLICRYLPGQQVRYLLDHLPAATKSRLPSLHESFSIPEPLVEQVRLFFERSFFSAPRPAPQEAFSLSHIAWMSARDMTTLIRELGYEEIRRAFASVAGKALQVFLTRFPIEEANQVRLRLARGRPVLAAERQRAQQHLVRVDLDIQRAADLPFEIGLSVLAQAVAPEATEWAKAVVYRLVSRDGHSLKRYVRESLHEHAEARQQHRAESLLAFIRDLAEQGKIATYWREESGSETTGSEKVSH